MKRLVLVITLLVIIALALIWTAKTREPLSPLVQAASTGDIASVRSLLESGADPDLGGGSNGWTPLFHAIHKNQKEAVIALLEGGADISSRAGNGDTPLMIAAGYGQTEIVKILLETGADVYATKQHGLTALDSALIGISDIDGFTMLRCQPATVEMLLDHAPDLTLYGDLAELMFLRLKHCPEVNKILTDRKVSKLRPSKRRR